MAPHSSTLAWKIPWTEEPGRLQSMGSHRVGHDCSDLAAAAAATTLIFGLPWRFRRYRIHLQCGSPGFDSWVGKIPWRREWLLTPVFWPGESHGLFSPCGHKESYTTEWLSLHFNNHLYQPIVFEMRHSLATTLWPDCDPCLTFSLKLYKNSQSIWARATKTEHVQATWHRDNLTEAQINPTQLMMLY